MLTSGHIMDEAIFHGLPSLKCLPECNQPSTRCLDKVSDTDVGVTASEAGSVPTSRGQHQQPVAALIITLVLLIAAAALLAWLLRNRWRLRCSLC